MSIITDTRPTEFTLEYCHIITSTEEVVDIRAMIVEFNYFEDIFTNGCSGHLMLSDSQNLQNKHSFSGNEYLRLKINKKMSDVVGGTSVPFSDYGLEKIFRIYSMRERNLTKDNNENYVLHFCSDEFFISQQYKISKGYKQAKISDIVYDIAETFLKIPSNKLNKSNFFETLGVYDIVIPNLMPLEAINWLCTRAMSADTNIPGASYVFYQDRDGWNFKPLVAIYGDFEAYSSGVYRTYRYRTKNDGVDQTAMNTDLTNIMAYQVMDSFDSFDAVQTGIFANKLLTTDHLTRTHNQVNFDYQNYFNDLKSNLSLYKNYHNYGIMSDLPNRHNETFNQTSDSTIKLVYSTSNLADNEYIKNNQPNITNNNLDKIIPYRYAQMRLVSAIRIKAVIPGDPYLTIGKVVYVELPSSTLDAKSTESKKELDKFYSGYYLVTAVRHRFTPESDFDTTVELSKDSFDSKSDYFGSGGLPSASVGSKNLLGLLSDTFTGFLNNDQ